MNAQTSYSLRKYVFWLGVVALSVLFIYAIKAILLPFVIGMLIAYFLDPAADKLEDWGCSRSLATILITLTFFSSLAIALAALSPLVYHQMGGLFGLLPDYITQWQDAIDQHIQEWTGWLNHSSDPLTNAKDAVSDFSSSLFDSFSDFSLGLLQSGAAIANLLSLLIITPVVSFYLLRDWDRVTEQIDRLLPLPYAQTIRELLHEMDTVIAGFVRGTLNVMVILGLFYIVGLYLIGLKFALVIGLIGGVMIIIPYLGTIISGLAAVGMAYFQFDEWTPVLLTLGVFTAGQILEGYVLTPKLVGDKVGLHPLWLIFGMLAGATLFGFVGIFLAVPVTAAIGVLVRFALKRYKQSDYYQGQSSSPSS